MNRIKSNLLILGSILIAACSSVKTTPASTAATVAKPLPPAKPTDGVYAPGNEELTAMKGRYPQTTLEQLNQGYVIYAKGACTNCHGTNNIYNHGEGQWKHIMDDMAPKANLSAVEREAVYQYVLSIIATQPKKG